MLHAGWAAGAAFHSECSLYTHRKMSLALLLLVRDRGCLMGQGEPFSYSFPFGLFYWVQGASTFLSSQLPSLVYLE